MEYQNYNQDPNQRVNKRILTIIFIAALILSFFLGFMISSIINVEPKEVVEETQTVESEEIEKLIARNEELLLEIQHLIKKIRSQEVGSVTEEQVIVYNELYDFLKENHHADINDDLIFSYMLQGLLESLNDPYTSFSLVPINIDDNGDEDADPETFEGLGVSFVYQDFEMDISEVMRHSPAELAKIYPGDKIIGVREGLINIIFRYRNFTQDEAIPYVRGKAGDQKTLIVKRLDGSVVHIPVEYAVFPRPTVTSNKGMGQSYGYIKIHQFDKQTPLVFAEHLAVIEQTINQPDQTLIIDLRDNPGGTLGSIVQIMQQLIEKKHTRVVGIKATKDGEEYVYGGGLKDKKPYNIKVLVNGNTASAAEMLAAALHYFGGYTIYGTPTYGKNVYQTTEIIPELMIMITYTEGYWFYGNYQIMDKDTNPIPVEIIEPTGLKTFISPRFVEEVSLDQVSQSLIIAQKFLNVYNPTFNVREDGYLDLNTQNALKQFQLDKGLPQTGKYDLATSHAMYTDYMNKLDDHNFDNQILSLISWS